MKNLTVILVALLAQSALAGPIEVDDMTAEDAEPFCTNQAIWKNFPKVKKEECVRVSLECYDHVFRTDQKQYKGLAGHNQCIFERLGVEFGSARS